MRILGEINRKEEKPKRCRPITLDLPLHYPTKTIHLTFRYTYKNDKGILKEHSLLTEDIHDIRLPILQMERLKLEKVPRGKLHQLQGQQLQEDPLKKINI